MKFKTEQRTIQGRQVFLVQKMHHSEWLDWVYISRSSIPEAGCGLFAAREFRKGERIGRYLGKLLGRKESFTDEVLKVKREATNLPCVIVKACLSQA